ncbi:hypothetical protein K432DRAFT_393489 [Lepidopterella palustris CBS 459.81]|uniref:Restriction endonuclease domain-containing protein n=1 Tax=Lepidopterella palustris CBS 459.81 TaxID=1314670 RepID=A0A8E2JEW6_9PEZI|nr:hypothetical protein K432DRAFT_393489 [Lepidopterella palustris CBS 459.81]
MRLQFVSWLSLLLALMRQLHPIYRINLSPTFNHLQRRLIHLLTHGTFRIAPPGHLAGPLQIRSFWTVADFLDVLVTLFADFSALGVAAAVMVEVFAEVSWPDASLEARNREVKNPRMSAVNGSSPHFLIEVQRDKMIDYDDDGVEIKAYREVSV